MLIYLMSDDIESLRQHPENVVSDFKINLAQKIELNGDWEVALVEAQIPYTWVEKKFFNIWIRYHIVIIKEQEEPISRFDEAPLEDISNLDVNEIVQRINKIMVEGEDKVNNGAVNIERNNEGYIKINVNHSKIQLHDTRTVLSKHVGCVKFSENLITILGFENTLINVEDRNNDFIADYPPFVPHKLPGIAIHCNLIENQYISSKFEIFTHKTYTKSS